MESEKSPKNERKLMDPKITSQLGSKNSKIALTPSEPNSKSREDCEKVVEATKMSAASKEKEKKDSILENEKRVELGMKGVKREYQAKQR